MMTSRQARTFLGLVFAAGLLIGLTGCDYWPPALLAQIEQLHSETQTLAMEKTQLQMQITDLAKSKQELQLQIDDLNRINREKTGLIASLQNQLNTLRAKAVKAPPSKALKAQAKPQTKSTPKRPAHKKKTQKKAPPR